MSAFSTAVFDNEVLYEVRDDGVALITLNAPHRLNTIGRKMASGVQHALDLASEDSKVRVRVSVMVMVLVMVRGSRVRVRVRVRALDLASQDSTVRAVVQLTLTLTPRYSYSPITRRWIRPELQANASGFYGNVLAVKR